MDSLSDKLKALGVKLGAQEIQSKVQPANYPIDSVLEGKIWSTIYGDVFYTDAVYPGGHVQGNQAISINHPLDILAEWGHLENLSQFEPRGFVFLDTETTGLAGGTGTFAFMVGVGRFQGEDFHLVQFFLRDPSEENAMLAALSEFTLPCQALVTYNGKSFDIPLLNTRYTLQAISSPFTEVDHIDLLHLARRLWRDRLPSRTLGYIEANILGASRTQEEVPGWLIPQYYFDYLKSGDARPLQGVFYHNAMDILSLAALLNHTTNLLSDPLAVSDVPGLDLVAMGKLYEDLGYLESAVNLYEQGLNQGLPEEFYWKTIGRFAALYKRSRAWESAVILWQKAADHGELYACIELAKYYEHITRELQTALKWTDRAIDLLVSGDLPLYLRKSLQAEYEHRQSRLKAKIG